mmetsp:Transcript_36606/g.67454  ORF Transcript_36606/g.67454 Transcript_36606/m.67454 type:complete len:212 (+) Transcript_36606:2933-3568(+)
MLALPAASLRPRHALPAASPSQLRVLPAAATAPLRVAAPLPPTPAARRSGPKAPAQSEPPFPRHVGPPAAVQAELDGSAARKSVFPMPCSAAPSYPSKPSRSSERLRDAQTCARCSSGNARPAVPGRTPNLLQRRTDSICLRARVRKPRVSSSTPKSALCRRLGGVRHQPHLPTDHGKHQRRLAARLRNSAPNDPGGPELGSEANQMRHSG